MLLHTLKPGHLGMKTPPKMIDGAVVLAWAIADAGNSFGISTVVLPEGREIKGLVIATYHNDPGYYVFACDGDWSVVGDTCHETLSAAKAFPPSLYDVDIVTWTDCT